MLPVQWVETGGRGGVISSAPAEWTKTGAGCVEELIQSGV